MIPLGYNIAPSGAWCIGIFSLLNNQKLVVHLWIHFSRISSILPSNLSLTMSPCMFFLIEDPCIYNVATYPLSFSARIPMSKIASVDMLRDVASYFLMWRGCLCPSAQPCPLVVTFFFFFGNNSYFRASSRVLWLSFLGFICIITSKLWSCFVSLWTSCSPLFPDIFRTLFVPYWLSIVWAGGLWLSYWPDYVETSERGVMVTSCTRNGILYPGVRRSLRLYRVNLVPYRSSRFYFMANSSASASGTPGISSSCNIVSSSLSVTPVMSSDLFHPKTDLFSTRALI